MADLTSTDVTITLQTVAPHNPRIEGLKRKSFCLVSFGDGALTYPSGGVPLPTYASWSLVRNLDYIELCDPNDASGLIWKYDKANHKLRAYQSAGFTPSGALAGHTHDLVVCAETTADAAAASVNASADPNLYVSSTGSDITVTGLTGGSVAHGGVSATAASDPAFTGVAVAAGVLAELGNVAVAAQTMYATAVGW